MPVICPTCQTFLSGLKHARGRTRRNFRYDFGTAERSLASFKSRQSPDWKLIAEAIGKCPLAIVGNKRHCLRACIEHGCPRLVDILLVHLSDAIHEQSGQSLRLARRRSWRGDRSVCGSLRTIPTLIEGWRTSVRFRIAVFENVVTTGHARSRCRVADGRCHPWLRIILRCLEGAKPMSDAN